MAYTQPAIESGSSRAGHWLRERRLKLALWIAVFEGIVVALRGDVSRWTVVAIAALVLIIYALLRDRIRWEAGNQVLWIVAASQVLAVLVVIAAFIIGAVALVLVALFALVALAYLFTDLRRT
jgi:acyl-coenzyme A synthetase/AMP-(fatty) acid ligase